PERPARLSPPCRPVLLVFASQGDALGLKVRRTAVRTWFTPVLLILAAGLVAAAQPPASRPTSPTKDPPPLIIKPHRPEDPTPHSTPQPDPPGVLIIPPKGQPAPTISAQPVQPQPVQAQPVLAPARVDGPALFDYWFAAAVDGQMIGYTHWHAAEVERNG